jgi:hypothetical protein
MELDAKRASNRLLASPNACPRTTKEWTEEDNAAASSVGAASSVCTVGRGNRSKNERVPIKLV